MKNKSYKVTILFLMQFITLSIFAQSPSLINYQGTARLADGTPLSNRSITIKFDLRETSSSGSIIATETQTIQTNNLGLFSTLIGQSTNLSNINWKGNSLFLQVSMDTSAGSNFTSVGVQQLVSVPYAIHASSVPSSYTNNILSIGNSTYALSPTIAVTPNTSITVSGLGTVTSVGTNTFDINIPSPTFSNTGQQIITGSYPNFTVNTPTVAAASNPSITLTSTAAAGTSVTSSGSSFSLNVPPPTFTNAGPATITGSYPNFTINSSAVTTYTNGAGIGLTSGSVIVNTSPNITPTVVVTNTAAAGSSVSSSGSSFSLNVPPPTFTNAGPATITGAYPNFTINSTAAPSYTSGTGISITSGSINNTAPDQTVTFTNTGQTLITGTYPTFSISTPTIANTSIVLTSTAAAGPSLTTSGTNSFNINIPSTNAWSLLGNAGTTASLNFIGTTDNVPLNFRVNNNRAGRIELGGSVYFGSNTGPVSNTLTNNIGIGRDVLPTTTGDGNTAIGSSAMSSNSTGDQNVAMGQAALNANTTGGSNVSLGWASTAFNTTGFHNVAVGTNALYTGNSSNNVAVGYFALASNTLSNVSAENVAIGAFAGLNNTSGTGNVFIGNYAGSSEMGSNKLYVTNGSGAPLLYGDFSTGNLGIATATTNAPLQFNNAIIGRKIVLWEGANNDNQVYGFGLNVNTLRYQVDNTVADHAFFAGVNATTSQELMRIKGTGNVGIGANNPAHKLDIVGTGGPRLRVFSQDGVFAGLLAKNNTHEYFIGIQADYESAGGVTSGFHIFDNTAVARRMVIDATGRMGINESAPTATLHVNGTTRLVDGTQGLGKVLTSDASGNATWQTPSAGGWGTSGNAGTSSGTNFIGTTDGQDLNFRTNNTLAASINTLGYVGISNIGGFATTRLSIYGSESGTFLNGFSASPGTSIRIHNNDLTNNNFSSLIFSSQASNAASFEVAKIVAQAMDHTAGSIAGDLVFLTRRPANIIETMRIKSNGFVGMGTSAPATNLHINSTTNTSEVQLTHTASVGSGLVLGTNNLGSSLVNNDNSPLFFATNGATGFIMASTGQVGIGNFSTTHKLNVDGNISLEGAGLGAAPSRTIGFPTGSTGTHGDLTIQAKSQVFSGTAFSGGNLILTAGDYNVGSPQTSGAFGGNVVIRAGHNLWPHTAGSLITFEAGVTAATERMRIDGGTGRVGIGTTAPDQLLTVNGNASKVGGGSWATFSDRRLKKDIRSYKDGLKELMKIEPVWYTYNGEANLPQETFVGVIAQDLQLVAPYMVKETNRGMLGDLNYLSVDNSAMTYMLINSVKEQQEQIEKQQKQIDELKELINQLLKDK